MTLEDPDLSPEPVELDEAGHVLLCGMRAIAVGRSECPTLRRMFGDLCGSSGEEALNILFVVIKQLAFTSKRRLCVHVPGCRRISRDEMMFLSALAAAQDDGAGAAPCTRLWLSRLTGREADASLVRSLGVLAGVLNANGRHIALSDPLEAAAAPGRSVAVH